MERLSKVSCELATNAAKIERRITDNEKQYNELTLLDYLHETHENLQKSITVCTIKKETTQGDITDPTGKLCPRKIEQWADFPLVQKRLWDRLGDANSTFSSEELFDSRDFLGRLRAMIKGHQISSEDDTAFVASLSLETPVANILEKMHQDSDIARAFKLDGEKLTFENHGNAVSEDQEITRRIEQLEVQTPGPHKDDINAKSFGRQADQSSKRAYMHADQICLYRKDGINELTLIVEYKAPHKLTLDTIHNGLRPMDPFDEVANRVDAAGLKAKAQFQVAAAITQTYDYMVRSRLAYGYLFTGEALIFLHIEGEDPTTIRYYLSVPQRMLAKGTLWESDGPSRPNRLHETAVCQVLIFCLQALAQQRFSLEWCENAKGKLKTWGKDDVEMLRKIPMTPLADVDASLFVPDATPDPEEITGSPGMLRVETRAMKKAKIRALQEAQSLAPYRKDDDHDDGNGDNLGHRQQDFAPDSPTPTPKSSQDGSYHRGGDGGSKRSDSNRQQRDYCTQACILGLTQQFLLDPDCPNIAAHRLHDPDRHVLTGPAFLRLIQAQMAHDLDIYVLDLGLTGARSALFKVILASHGYAVMGKGTVFPWIPDLKHEELIYMHVRALQGRSVPVCIGSIDLEWYYQYSAFEQLEFMMFMAYGGMPLYKYERDGYLAGKSKELPIERVASQATEILAELHRWGVAQRDVALRNILWDEQARRVMYIDFERSVLFGREDGVRGKLGKEVKTYGKGDATAEDSQHHGESQKENVKPSAPLAPEAPPIQHLSAASPARQPLGKVSPNASRKRKRGDGKQVHFSLPPPPASPLQSSAAAPLATGTIDLPGQRASMETQPQWKVIMRPKYDVSWLSDWETEKAKEAQQMQAQLAGWVQRMVRNV